MTSKERTGFDPSKKDNAPERKIKVVKKGSEQDIQQRKLKLGLNDIERAKDQDLVLHLNSDARRKTELEKAESYWKKQVSAKEEERNEDIKKARLEIAKLFEKIDNKTEE